MREQRKREIGEIVRRWLDEETQRIEKERLDDPHYVCGGVNYDTLIDMLAAHFVESCRSEIRGLVRAELREILDNLKGKGKL